MDAILGRRSIRRYTARPVPEDLVRYFLTAGMSAPSAGDERPWHFVVIRDRRTLDAVPGVHPYAAMLKEAPLAVLVCGDETLEKHRGYWVQDCSAATENILVAVQAKGLGGVWLGVYPREDRVRGLRDLLGIPAHVTPFSLVAIGYPAEEKPRRERYEPQKVHEDRW